MVEVNLVYLGIAMLLAPALGEVGKIRARTDKGFAWLATSGALYLLAAAFSYDVGYGLGGTLAYGTTIFSAIGLITTLIGAIVILTSLMK